MATQAIERPVERHADLDSLFPGRYLSVTSFKRDGSGVTTPVWSVSDGKRLFALTDLHSAKVRRMRRNPRVLVAPCHANGKVRRASVPARAEVLTAATELEHVQKLLRKRYKISYRLVMLGYPPPRSAAGPRGSSSVSLGALEEPRYGGVPAVRGHLQTDCNPTAASTRTVGSGVAG